MDEKCVFDPERDCAGMRKANEVSGDVKALDRRLGEFQQAVSDTNSRFGTRIGKLESRDEVREEQNKNIREKLEGITREVTVFQREQKESIADLRKEHKESMAELRKGNKEIIDIVTPLRHKIGAVDQLTEDVEELKEKPGETWEHIKRQGLGWVVALMLAVLAVALGLGNYL